MYVDRIELSELAANRDKQIYTGQLRFFLTEGADKPVHTTSLNCRTLMLDVEALDEIHTGLVRDALRQLQWMPEVRFGTVSLTNLPEITVVAPRESAA